MISKKEIVRGMDSLDERICDLRYDFNLLNKRYDALLDKFNALAKVVLKEERVGRPKKEEVKEVKKVGRPRKNVQRVDFAKKK